MENAEESKDLDMLAFSQFVEAKFKTLDEEEDEFMTPVVQQSDIQKMRHELIKSQQNKLSHNFTPKTPGKPSQMTHYEPK